jgi:hypothetical protein
MSDPWSSGAIGWLVSKLLDGIARIGRKQTISKAEHERVKARLIDLADEVKRLTEQLNDETALRLGFQTKVRLLEARLKQAEKASGRKRPKRKSS